MGRRLIQALVIKGMEILICCKTNENDQEIFSYLTSDVQDEEEALACISKEVKDKLGITTKSVFRFRKEIEPDTVTFLMEVVPATIVETSEEPNKDLHENKSRELIWSPVKSIGDIDTLYKYLILLYGECVDRNYEPECIDDLEAIAAARYGSYSALKKRKYKIMENIDNHTPFSEKAYTIVVALILGIMFDRFFVEKKPGISVILFVFGLIAFFLWSTRKRIRLSRNIGWFLVIPIVLLSLCFAIYSNGILMSLNTLLIPFLMGSASILIINPELL